MIQGTAVDSANVQPRSKWSFASGDVKASMVAQTDNNKQDGDEEKGNDDGKQKIREGNDEESEFQFERIGSDANDPGYLMRVTKSSKGHVNCHDEMEETELMDILQANKSLRRMQRIRDAAIVAKVGERAASFKCILKGFKIVELAMSKDAKTVELLVDSFVGVAILANSLFLGFSMDAESTSSGAYLVAEIVFTAIFLGEVILKIYLRGFYQQYCGKEWLTNIFDATIISADTVHLFLILAFARYYSSNSSTFNASIFRVVRLVRLARILRILRSQVFKDLLSMIQGMLGGLSTLLWAVAFFVIFIYVVALVFRDTLGRDLGSGESDENGANNEDNRMVQLYFSSVPTSMFTIFRCSFGECSTKIGSPIFEHVTEVHGGLWAVMYSLFLFIVVVGIFNVISAIFVQSTMASAELLASKTKQERLDDKNRWAKNVVTLLRSFLMVARPDMEGVEEFAEGAATDTVLHEMMHMSFPRHVIDEVVHKDEQALHALTKLDIDPSDHKYLSDILDPANTGSISILSMVDGLKRLRGEPRRSDIITVDLMIRSSQKKVDDIWRWSKEILRNQGTVIGTDSGREFK